MIVPRSFFFLFPRLLCSHTRHSHPAPPRKAALPWWCECMAGHWKRGGGEAKENNTDGIGDTNLVFHFTTQHVCWCLLSSNNTHTTHNPHANANTTQRRSLAAGCWSARCILLGNADSTPSRGRGAEPWCRTDMLHVRVKVSLG